jgi:hypothetical protein
VFAGPVDWTEHMTTTELNPTAKDWFELVATDLFAVYIKWSIYTKTYMYTNKKIRINLLIVTIYTNVPLFTLEHTSLGKESSHLVSVYIPLGCARTMWSCLCSKKEKWNHTASWLP